MAGVQPDAERIRMAGADGYSSMLSLDEALQPENFLAYELEGEPLPVLHGFPLRAVIPAHIGAFWVKWLVEIKVE
jgi:sulfite dehydrogenase